MGREFMEGISSNYIDVLVVLVVLGAMFFDFMKTKKHRNRIKERDKKEFEGKIELSADELESRLGESELLYEDLEQTYWVQAGLLLGICSYLYWHVWYVSIISGVGVAFVGWKYIALRPFSNGANDHST